MHTKPVPVTERPDDTDLDLDVDDAYQDTGSDSIDEPRVPIADKGEVARVRPDDDQPADGPGDTPRPFEGEARDLAETDGLIDPEPELEELDFDDGSMSSETLTQGDAVIDAEYEDRGPATHLHSDDDSALG